MRSSLVLACLVLACLVLACLSATLMLTAQASAQSPFDGPLSPAGAPAAKLDAPLKHAKAKPRKTRRVVAKTPADGSASAAPFDARSVDPHALPLPTSNAPSVRQDAPSDPLSYGMKWQGNNDTVGETRSQNLDGNAYGSGAQVGMKLHF